MAEKYCGFKGMNRGRMEGFGNMRQQSEPANSARTLSGIGRLARFPETRIHFITLAALAVAVLLWPVPFVGAQEPRAAAAAQYDPTDLSGVWTRNREDRGVSREVPPMTPEGEARFNANTPSYGRPLGSPLNGEHIGRVRAVPPALGNSLVGQCNPVGIPRIYYDAEPWEFIQTGDGDRILQFFSWTRPLREIWMDGREVPEDWSHFTPTWYGYNVGRWEGDTLVVESFGYDSRSWLDHFGYPHSEEMRIVERFRRIATDSLEHNMTINDPRTYTTPWVAETKTFRRVARGELMFGDWYGMFEEHCVPLDELRFNDRVRDPAGGVND